MVELPNHKDQSSRFSRIRKTIHQWFQRDFNQPKPLSSALAILPLLPAIFASELGLNDNLGTLLAILGAPFAIGWLAYTIYRQFKNSFRDIRHAFADINARKQGEEIPTRCPGCGLDLPAFIPPNDGNVYQFMGWNCENCGTMIDRTGNSI
jgi:hypothetical protein